MTRATGIVTLLMLTLSVFLGVVTRSRRSTRRLPRFVVVGLHRNVSLMVLIFLALHVATTVIDSYTSISLLDAFVPFLSQYRTEWLGLGTIASDVLVVLVLTSLMRERIGYRTWKVLHWLSYACWPVAVLHAWGTGTDPGVAWGRWIGYGCVAAIGTTVLWRLVIAARPDPADTLAP
ncbi:ferric reductase-like transmembrane domain-containing protein [Catenulispora sp. GAS73]|uniref:ferric reductase-like transmembrane domain-containing protein n=1 Tax=Catenulispora sp. GAS73 TaxID=3156269 RepID=UPI003512B164